MDNPKTDNLGHKTPNDDKQNKHNTERYIPNTRQLQMFYLN